jgi:hypothetical protein
MYRSFFDFFEKNRKNLTEIKIFDKFFEFFWIFAMIFKFFV